ncbi:hypothetical protein GIB67_040856 [Kingdonia uniflora]|uniref:Uncharacterized protein n=1 Tax=Kingdonia uniflora TaxID=39325 RepID=A0A7J7L840_9MAGN|nr:hypothetical protein GIB67_040856 [Kingdonia uniflora]
MGGGRTEGGSYWKWLVGLRKGKYKLVGFDIGVVGYGTVVVERCAPPFCRASGHQVGFDVAFECSTGARRLRVGYYKVVEVTSENSNEEFLIDGANDDAVNCVNVEKDKDVVEIAREENANEESKKGTPPSIGMIFESFDDAYNFYNLHGKCIGFGVKVNKSYYIEKTKERYHAILSCCK